jgi:hypothetical protein
MAKDTVLTSITVSGPQKRKFEIDIRFGVEKDGRLICSVFLT